ncbi:hypothetical protein Clacol_000599 [Clathrus columnatus]|uniref:Uncharacterized protein n=1 Tax=Clathrus columnatus TaxID=1419009 RepID=A0AAV4ZYX4_9AGAM|nr:hypothetical protein Clacol_000599 [Clathrus columnatus]
MSRITAMSELTTPSSSVAMEPPNPCPLAFIRSTKPPSIGEAVFDAFNLSATINATPTCASACITTDPINTTEQSDSRIQTREDHSLSRLGFLAAVCASSSIRWDPLGKHHYLHSLDDSELLEVDFRDSDVALGKHKNTKESLSNIDTQTDLQVNIENYPKDDRGGSPLNYILDDAPSSPTLHSMSSPTTTHVDFVSTPPTFAASSPIKTAGDFFNYGLSDDFHDIPPLAIEMTPIHLSHRSKRSPALISNPPIKSHEVVSSSPSQTPKPIVLADDTNLSPLSSLVSSPLNIIFDDESHFRYDFSSVLSSRSVTPDLETSDGVLEMASSTGVHRASTGEALTPPNSQYKEHRFDTAPPESVPKKRCRGSSPSPPSLHPIELQDRQNKSNSRMEISRGIRRRPTRQSGSIMKTKRKTKARLFRKQNIAIDKDELSTLGTKTLQNDLTALPMTGFLVETLALSRASAITAPELLQIVLKSQPHLKEEHSEDLWLAIVKEILNGVKMFGKIERNGLSAADHPLEDEWFYIPENDEEPGRADLLKGLMPKKRAVTKQAKQYYFEPITKLTRWDPED